MLADQDLSAVIQEQAQLGKLLAFAVACDDEPDTGAIRALCRAIRSTVATEDQAGAKLAHLLNQGRALEQQAGRSIWIKKETKP